MFLNDSYVKAYINIAKKLIKYRYQI